MMPAMSCWVPNRMTWTRSGVRVGGEMVEGLAPGGQHDAGVGVAVPGPGTDGLLGVEQLIHSRPTDTEHVCGLPHGQQQLLHSIVSSLVLMLQLATLSARGANKGPTC